MALIPRNATVRKDLTSYALAVAQDAQKIRAMIARFAPTVQTGVTDGSYNKFTGRESFAKYAKAYARRAVGSQANRIPFLTDTGTFALQPYGLRIDIDNHEAQKVDGDPAGLRMLEEAKTQALTASCFLATLGEVITAIDAAVTATAGQGKWNDPNVDPVQELNNEIKAFFLATGLVPNKITFDFGAYCVFAGNPLVLKRMPGATVASITPANIAAMLVTPNIDVAISDVAEFNVGGVGATTQTFKSVLGGKVYIHYTSAMPSVYDPSFMKTFAQSANLFTDIYTYREEPHLTWYENDWTAQVVVVASTLCRSITVTNATA
jgi:hypothetical protein